MFKEIFTWWNGQTIGTRIWSYFNGIKVGTDNLGNKYYKNKNDTKRWVIYGDYVESTNVNAEWNNWLRFTSLNEPSEIKKYDWQKKHSPNLTGTPEAYDPNNDINENDQRRKSDEYTKWKP